jgi:hypothetical protein
VVDSHKNIIGIMTIARLTNSIASGCLRKDQSIEKIIESPFRLLKSSDPLDALVCSLQCHQYVIIQDGNRFHVCEHQDLLNYLMTQT